MRISFFFAFRFPRFFSLSFSAFPWASAEKTFASFFWPQVARLFGQVAISKGAEMGGSGWVHCRSCTQFSN